MTKEQIESVDRWFKALSPHSRGGAIIVALRGELGGSAEVRIEPDGKITSTTTGLEVRV